MGHTVTYFLSLLLLLFPQNPSLDSGSPKERSAAVEKMAVIGNREAIPQLAAALKKEPKSDIRAEMVAALGRIADEAVLVALGRLARRRPDFTSAVLEVLDDLDDPRAARIAAGIRQAQAPG